MNGGMRGWDRDINVLYWFCLSLALWVSVCGGGGFDGDDV